MVHDCGISRCERMIRLNEKKITNFSVVYIVFFLFSFFLLSVLYRLHSSSLPTNRFWKPITSAAVGYWRGKHIGLYNLKGVNGREFLFFGYRNGRHLSLLTLLLQPPSQMPPPTIVTAPQRYQIRNDTLGTHSCLQRRWINHFKVTF